MVDSGMHIVSAGAYGPLGAPNEEEIGESKRVARPCERCIGTEAKVGRVSVSVSL